MIELQFESAAALTHHYAGIRAKFFPAPKRVAWHLPPKPAVNVRARALSEKNFIPPFLPRKSRILRSQPELLYGYIDAPTRFRNEPEGRDWLVLGAPPVIGDDAVMIVRPRWRTIICEVAKKHGLSVIDMSSPRRDRASVSARHEAMWRMRHETPMSLPDIGHRLGGRDHTTVMHGIAKHQARIDGGESV